MPRIDRPPPLAIAQVRSQINVTPLVDVCLVLLIVFMVVTPLLGHDTTIQLPATASPPPLPEKHRQAELSLHRDGSVFLDRQRILSEQLPATLLQLSIEGRPVVLRADRRLPYRSVLSLMRQLRDAEIRRVGLVVEPLRDRSRSVSFAPGALRP